MSKPSIEIWARDKSFSFQPNSGQQGQGFDYLRELRGGVPITDDHDWPLKQITTALQWALQQIPDGGLGEFLRKNNNLGDLQNAATARSNLGLGTAAVADSSTFLSKNRNLADLDDKNTALSNLGLTHVAGKQIGTTSGTIAAGDDYRFGLAVGVNQSWQSFSSPGSRTNNVTYTNSTGRPIVVAITSATASTSKILVNGVTISAPTIGGGLGGNQFLGAVIVPSGATYMLSSSTYASSWAELR